MASTPNQIDSVSGSSRNPGIELIAAMFKKQEENINKRLDKVENKIDTVNMKIMEKNQGARPKNQRRRKVCRLLSEAI